MEESQNDGNNDNLDEGAGKHFFFPNTGASKFYTEEDTDKRQVEKVTESRHFYVEEETTVKTEFVPEVVTETSVTFETSTVSSTTAELVTSVPETTSETSTLSSTTAESVTSVPDTTTITEGPAVLEKTTVSVAEANTDDGDLNEDTIKKTLVPSDQFAEMEGKYYLLHVILPSCNLLSCNVCLLKQHYLALIHITHVHPVSLVLLKG
ncbi:uncharacterized protein LOC116410880 [Xenopus tropicalis]|uniref:Uncharacterized protein LOC116410880 n=1 Tax=Xenopus tropicalis TaxID=8364 RepID=A0A8J1JJT0_XENTR|nr:uncharacterized protein LOC116410880 [Xenopus tropicalis]